MRWEKAVELNELERMLRASFMGVTYEEICKRFDVSRRTAERMVEALVSTAARRGEELTTTIDDDRYKRIRLPTLRNAISITAQELADLETAARVLESNGRQDLAETLRSIGERLRAQLDRGSLRRIEPDLEALLVAEGVAMSPGPRPAIDAQVIDTIRGAILANKTVSFNYTSRAGRAARHTRIAPYGFLFGQSHYLVAIRGTLPEPMLFRLGAIEHLVVENRSFVRRPDFDLKAFSERSFGVFQEQPIDVELVFSKSVADRVREFRFHPTQKIKANGNGSLSVQFHAGGIDEICFHLFTWGKTVKIKRPARLRNRLREMCRTASRGAQ